MPGTRVTAEQHAAAARNEQVTHVQDTLMFEIKAKREAVYAGVLALDAEVRQAFFLSFEIGYGLEPHILAEIAERPYGVDLPEHWLQPEIFTDDRNFCQERFYLAVHALGDGDVDPRWQLAVEQARRMLAAGRVDPEYFGSLRCRRGAIAMVDAFQDELMAYVPKLLHDARRTLRMVGSSLQNVIAVKWSTELTARIDAATLMRGQLFHDVWLPAQISAAEYAQVKDFSIGILRTLYASVWAEGYYGYRRVMIESGRA